MFLIFHICLSKYKKAPYKIFTRNPNKNKVISN